MYIILYVYFYIFFRYGGTLIYDGELSGGHLLIVFFSVMMGANQFGQVGPNIESFASARGAAHEIYRLIERKPEIDSMSDVIGTKPEIHGDVSFKDCQFTYPSRPDVQVCKEFCIFCLRFWSPPLSYSISIIFLVNLYNVIILQMYYT